MRKYQSVACLLTVFLLLQLGLSGNAGSKAPPTDPSAKDQRVDPAAARRLSGKFGDQKANKEVEESPYKFLAFCEGDDRFFAFAADKVTFTKEGRLRVTPMRMVSFQITDGREQATGVGISEKKTMQAELWFDRPVQKLDDLRRAKLLELRWGPELGSRWIIKSATGKKGK